MGPMTGNYAIYEHGISGSKLLAVLRDVPRFSARKACRHLRGDNNTIGRVIREEWVDPIMAIVLDTRLTFETERNLKQQAKTDHIADATAYDLVNEIHTIDTPEA